MASLRTIRLAEAVDISTAKYGIILGVCEARFPFAAEGLRCQRKAERGKKELKSRPFGEQDLQENYADGFDFRETSRRLVEGRVGKAITEAVAKALQARMFERKDGVWLFPQMVMDDAARVKMTARAKELLANEGAFAAA